MEQVILVNSKDVEIGVMDKLDAHKTGELHRAFSILVFNSKGEMLLQKRAESKYHSGGLWTNACCSHQKPNEDSLVSVKRRLKEEIGLTGDPQFLYKFIYKAELDNNLIEHEYDHVFTCTIDETPIINPEEVSAFKYVSLTNLFTDIDVNPSQYSFWFKMIVENLKGRLELIDQE
jgi:isopentenyl-diphosphate delta-isomerase